MSAAAASVGEPFTTFLGRAGAFGCMCAATHTAYRIAWPQGRRDTHRLLAYEELRDRKSRAGKAYGVLVHVVGVASGLSCES